MRTDRSVLLVEDDPDQVEMWTRDIAEFNGDEAKPFRIILHSATTLLEAQAALRERLINAAIVDLRIPGGPGQASVADSGNTAIRGIIDVVAGPTAIFSGHAAEVGEFVQMTPIRSFPKEADQLGEILNWLCDHAPLMTALDEVSLDIRRETARVFAGMIWKRWEQTKGLDLSTDILRQVVTRQVVSHIGEMLSLPLNSAPPYHPYEFYFQPPLRLDRMHTGDLILLDNITYVILTPQCDMIRKYPEKVILAKCNQIKDWSKVKAPEKKRYAAQGHAAKTHFLPLCDERGPWLVEFNSLITRDGDELDSLLDKRFASIAPQFVPNLIQRFSNFIGRIGQPDLQV